MSVASLRRDGFNYTAETLIVVHFMYLVDGLGVARGVPSLFYFVSAAAGAVQMLILAALFRAPDPAPSVKAE